jgi:hypothetical protein
LYGELGSTEEFIEFINSVFQSVTDENVKYVQDTYSAICHFSSLETIDSMSEFFNYIFDERIVAFFLMERPNKVGVRLESRLADHLFDLKISTGYNNPSDIFGINKNIDEEFIKWNRKQIDDLGVKDEKGGFNEEEESINDVRNIKQNYKEPLRMDMILDKIARSGIESLTSEEKKYLKNLSD